MCHSERGLKVDGLDWLQERVKDIKKEALDCYPGGNLDTKQALVGLNNIRVLHRVSLDLLNTNVLDLDLKKSKLIRDVFEEIIFQVNWCFEKDKDNKETFNSNKCHGALQRVLGASDVFAKCFDLLFMTPVKIIKKQELLEEAEKARAEIAKQKQLLEDKIVQHLPHPADVGG